MLVEKWQQIRLSNRIIISFLIVSAIIITGGLAAGLIQFSLGEAINAILMVIAITLLIWIKPFSRHPWANYLLNFYFFYSLSFIALGYISTLLLHTPFPLIDNKLFAIDQAMGFHLDHLVNWVHSFPAFARLLNLIYSSLFYQLLFLPLLIGLMRETRDLQAFLLANVIMSVLTMLTYFFLPSNDPADIYHDIHFSAEQIAVVTQFNFIHHHVPVSNYVPMVSFPSCHVIWALMLIMLVRSRKPLFESFIIINGLLIFSALTSGWHFLIDVLGGLLYAVISIGLAYWLIRREERQPSIPVQSRDYSGLVNYSVLIFCLLVLIVNLVGTEFQGISSQLFAVLS
jgi:membrane-associated phospholipid phosphatase